MSDQEEWVKAAIIDDTVVAELLLHLNYKVASSSPPKTVSSVQYYWPSVRQRRSKKPAPTGSPTTPLSWSGATSISGGGGGCEESSRFLSPSKPPSNTRSEANGTNETSTSKRLRKKKKLAELKEEEALLIKERKQLTRKLALLRSNVDNQRDTNQSLKKIKLDLRRQQASERGKTIVYDGVSSESPVEVSPSNNLCIHPTFRENVAGQVSLLASYAGCCEEHKEVKADQEPKFMLPDLNLIPFDADSNIEIPVGAS